MTSEANYKTVHGEGLKTLTPKQMLQKLSIFLAQVKAGNRSENLLNEIRPITYHIFYVLSKEITKKVYNNIMSSVTLYNKIDTIFMNSEDS